MNYLKAFFKIEYMAVITGYCSWVLCTVLISIFISLDVGAMFCSITAALGMLFFAVYLIQKNYKRIGREFKKNLVVIRHERDKNE